jgi:L-rhamnose mutarotase
MHNYTGFIGGPNRRLVVGYFETSNLERVWSELAGSEVNQRWSAGIVPLMETGGDISNGSMEFLEPVWFIP